MIWSQEQASVQKTLSLLTRGKMLETSGKVHEWLDQADQPQFEPVSYFNAGSAGERLVTTYASLGLGGQLVGESAYGINSELSRDKNLAKPTQQAIREAHALAERTALTRGIYTPHGRSTAEEILAYAVPQPFRKAYIGERQEYLDVLRHDLDDTPALVEAAQMTTADILTVKQQLQLGQVALTHALKNM